LKEVSKRKKIWKYIQQNPHVTFINISAGYADLEVEFVIEDLDDLLEYMDDVQLEFLNAIRKFNYFGDSSHDILTKVRCFPELTEKDFKK